MTQYTYQPNPLGTPPEPTPRRGMPLWAKILIGFGVMTVILIILACAGLMWFGKVSPDLMAVPGSQMRSQDKQTIRDLHLLNPGEEIKFFYSDGVFAVEEGMYFFTNERIIVYSEETDPAQPLTAISYREILDLSAEFNDGFFDDSIIWIETEDDMIPFPVSSEGGADKRFFKMLEDTWEVNRN